MSPSLGRMQVPQSPDVLFPTLAILPVSSASSNLLGPSCSWPFHLLFTLPGAFFPLLPDIFTKTSSHGGLPWPHHLKLPSLPTSLWISSPCHFLLMTHHHMGYYLFFSFISFILLIILPPLQCSHWEGRNFLLLCSLLCHQCLHTA